MSLVISPDFLSITVHGIPVQQCYFHVYDPLWRRRGRVGTHWSETNLMDKFIELLRNKSYSRKQLAYFAVKDGYGRDITSQCLDLLPLLEYVEIRDGLYVYMLDERSSLCKNLETVNPEDVW